MAITIKKTAEGQMADCAYELVGVFDPARVVVEFGVEAAFNFSQFGHPRRYWLEKAGGLGGSVYVPRIPGRDEKHAPFAVFVATREANPCSKFPSHADVLAYRAAYPCLIFDDGWETWADVVHSSGGRTELDFSDSVPSETVSRARSCGPSC